MTNQMAWIRKRRGFTLVEIIVVLVILAILAAFTIPAMLGFVEDARSKAAITQARELYEAAQASATELYPEYSGYDDGIRYLQNKDCKIKIDLADKINAKVNTDLTFKFVMTEDADSVKITPGGIQCKRGSSYNGNTYYPKNSFEVAVSYDDFSASSTDTFEAAKYKKRITSAGCAKIWFHAIKKNGNEYNRSVEAFKVMAVQYTSQDGKYMVTILQDPTNRGVKTTVEKISDILNSQ